jgi:hypothetical protein
VTTGAESREQARFWTLARPLLRRAGVTRSTMMGFPCLRLDGDFFASCDHRTGELVVKLDEQRARALVEAGTAEPFAPNGRRFREWVTVPHRGTEAGNHSSKKPSSLPRPGGQAHDRPDGREACRAEGARE